MCPHRGSLQIYALAVRAAGKHRFFTCVKCVRDLCCRVPGLHCCVFCPTTFPDLDQLLRIVRRASGLRSIDPHIYRHIVTVLGHASSTGRRHWVLVSDLRQRLQSLQSFVARKHDKVTRQNFTASALGDGNTGSFTSDTFVGMIRGLDHVDEMAIIGAPLVTSS